MACLDAMEVTIDLMEIIRPLLPLLEELERIEAKAAGKPEEVIQLLDGTEEADQGPEGSREHDARVEDGHPPQR